MREGLLSPDERIRFVKEAEACHEQFENFDWRDAAGRKWTIRPGIKDEAKVVLIQCGRDDHLIEAAIPWIIFSAEAAETAIDIIDRREVWA